MGLLLLERVAIKARVEVRFPKRERPPHYPAFDRSDSPVVHFVTVCTKDRRPLLAAADAHRVLLEAWKSADSVKIGHYVIMPDHVHLFCEPVNVRANYYEVLDPLLEIAHHPQAGISEGRATLAAGFLGFATAQGRKL